MRKFRFALPALAIALVALLAAAQPTFAQSKIEKLLADTGTPSVKVGDGVYKAAYNFQDHTETVLLRELQLGDKPNDALKLIQILIPLVTFEQGTKVPAAAQNKIAEMVGDMTVGKIVIWPDGVLYASTLWYSTANGDTLETELILANINAKKAREQLAPFFKE